MLNSRNLSFTEDNIETHTHNVTNIEDHRIDHLISSHKKEVSNRRKKSYDFRESQQAKIIPMPMVSQSISPIKAPEPIILEALNESEEEDAEDLKINNLKLTDFDKPVFLQEDNKQGDEISFTNPNQEMSEQIENYKPDHSEKNEQTFNVESMDLSNINDITQDKDEKVLFISALDDIPLSKIVINSEE